MNAIVIKSFVVLLSVCVLLTIPNTVSSNGLSGDGYAPIVQADQAGSALQQGRQLLKRGKADQALVQLQTALNLYTAAKNNRGVAAAHNELGDLYLRQGQDKVALEHYRRAFEALSGVRSQEESSNAAAGSAARMAGSNAATAVDTAAKVSDTDFNANLILAKIGDTNG